MSAPEVWAYVPRASRAVLCDFCGEVIRRGQPGYFGRLSRRIECPACRVHGFEAEQARAAIDAQKALDRAGAGAAG